MKAKVLVYDVKTKSTKIVEKELTPIPAKTGYSLEERISKLEKEVALIKKQTSNKRVRKWK